MNTNMNTIANSAAIALGNDGENYRFFGILNADKWELYVPYVWIYRFEDGSCLLDTGSCWDEGSRCEKCGELYLTDCGCKCEAWDYAIHDEGTFDDFSDYEHSDECPW